MARLDVVIDVSGLANVRRLRRLVLIQVAVERLCGRIEFGFERSARDGGVLAAVGRFCAGGS